MPDNSFGFVLCDLHVRSPIAVKIANYKRTHIICQALNELFLKIIYNYLIYVANKTATRTQTIPIIKK